MHSTLIVARMLPEFRQDVSTIFSAFDSGVMPDLMGTRRRELFSYHGLYFHLQDFDEDSGGEQVQAARSHPEFQRISERLKPFIEAYDPATWQSPADAMASRFYHWQRPAR